MIMELFYVFLLIFFPITSAYSSNFSSVKFKDYVTIFSLVFLVSIFSYALISLIFDSRQQQVFTLLFFWVMYANYIFIYFVKSRFKRTRKVYNRGFILVYCVSFCLLSVFIYYADFEYFFSIVSTIFYYFLLFVDSILLIDIIIKLARQKTRTRNLLDNLSTASTNIQAISLQNIGQKTPNIYHIILDEHAGFNDKECCDKSFYEGLKKRGFKIFSDHKANYNVTLLSRPSILNMKYYLSRFYSRMDLGKSSVIDRFIENGYKCSLIETSSWFGTKSGDFSGITLIRSGSMSGSNLLVKLGLNTSISFLKLISFPTIFFVILADQKIQRVIESVVSKKKIDLTDSYKTFLGCAGKNSKEYIFMHLIAPHPPYTHTEDGNEIDDEHIADDQYYFTYQKYINNKTLNFIDELKHVIDKNSIIMIHSDHGHDMTPEKRHSILSSVYYPDDKNALPDSMSLVNLYRYIFNCYFGDSFEILDDEYFQVFPDDPNDNELAKNEKIVLP